MRHRLLLPALLLVALAACSLAKAPEALPPTTTTTSLPTTTTTLPDLSQIALSTVPSKPTRAANKVVMGPGGATIGGIVMGPEGPVADAVVHVERLVDNSAAATDVRTLADGTWSLPGILGGRLRVRAWRPPDLAMIQAEVFFLAATEIRTTELRLERFAGPFPAATVAPTPPRVGQPATLVVQVTNRSVDAKGVVRAVPIPGVRMELTDTGFWQVQGANPTVTDATGRGQWQVVCAVAGPQPLSVVLDGTGHFPLQLPACANPPPPPTTRPTTATTARPPG